MLEDAIPATYFEIDILHKYGVFKTKHTIQAT